MYNLQNKIAYSVELIKKGERLALKMQPEFGYHVGFSGGKDSQVVLELVKMAGVKYHAVYNVTTNDPADNVRFIKNKYPDVEFSVPKESLMKMIERKGVPTMFHRWCCAILKETSGIGCVVLTGVRKEESRKRAAYKEFVRYGKTSHNRESVDIEKMQENEFRCVSGKDKFMIYPILEWTENDVWDFIKMRGLPINPCYERHQRVGCVFCPFARPKEIRSYCETHPKLKSAFIHAIEIYREKEKDRQKLLTADEYFDWWLSKERLNDYIAKKKQLSLFQ